MLIDCPVLLLTSVLTLLLPQNPAATYPLLPKMSLTAFLESYGLSEQSKGIIISLWRDSATQRQYDSYIRQWLSICSERHVNVTSPPLDSVTEFLTTLFQCIKYNTISTVLIHYVGRPLGWTASSGH